MASTFTTGPSSPLQQAAHSPPLRVTSTVASHPSNFSYNELPQLSLSVNPGAFDSAISTAVASPYLSALESSPSNFTNTNFNVDIAVTIPAYHELGLESPVPSFSDPSHSSHFTHHPPLPVPAAPPAIEPMDLAVPVPAPAISTPYMLFKHDPSQPTGLPIPCIHRLIPAAGPTYGGMEVTVLGANFHPSMQLNCVFGSTPSASTQRWSDDTLVCILPPSASPGQVHVWFEGLPNSNPNEEDGAPPCLFTYTDEADRALMKLALQVVGWKMTGQIEDARHIALRIVRNTGGPGPERPAGMSARAQRGAMERSSHLLEVLGRTRDDSDFEKVLLLDFLAPLLDRDVPAVRVHAAIPCESDSGTSTISKKKKKTASGHTLLHFATVMLAKVPSLVGFLVLVSQGPDSIGARDSNGCTTVSLSALAGTGSAACARAVQVLDAGAALAAGNTLAPRGFPDFDFDFVASGSVEDSPSSEDDEAAWGDAEDESDVEVERHTTSRRRRRRRRCRRLSRTSTLRPRGGASTTAVGLSGSSLGPDHAPSSAPAETKAMEAGLAAADNEKHTATPTFLGMLYHTLAQFQGPQGIVSNVPSSNLPDMPNWGALRQVPAVFPVLALTPNLQWGDRRTRGGAGDTDGADSEPGSRSGPKSGFADAAVDSDSKSLSWEKCMQQMTARADDGHGNDMPPTVYAPRGTGPIASEAEAETRRAAPSARQVGYGKSGGVPAEEEVELYSCRPTRHKAPRGARKKHDLVLVLFWIPILLISFARAAAHASKLALRRDATVKAHALMKAAQVGLQA